MVLWGGSSVSAVQEGEGRQETGKLFMKGRDQKEGEAPKSMREPHMKQQRESRKGFLS